MKFENANQTSFLGRWQYSIKLVHQLTTPLPSGTERWRSKQEFLAVEALEGFLKYRAQGPWERQGNVIYVEDLGDAFNLRLYFEPDIQVIQKAQLPLA
jgi:hypothetical protein